jgi:hypothetical protein
VGIAAFRKVEEEVKGGQGLSVKRMVERAQGSRASFYRFDKEAEALPDPDMDLRDSIQRVALEWPSYGWRRITTESGRRRRGLPVNRKRVYRWCAKTICSSSESASLCRRPIPTTAERCIQTWRGTWC